APCEAAMADHVERFQVAWLRYRVPGPVLYHQRLLLKQLRSSGDSWVVLTPDGDMYVEDLEVNDDVREVLYDNTPGVEPAQVRGRGYRFGQMPAADGLRRLAQQAETLRDQEDAVRGYRAPAEGAGSLGGFEPVGGTETPRGAPALPPPLPPPSEAPGPPGRWVIAVDTGEGKVGDSIAVADASRVSGDTRIGVAQVSNGAWVFVERLLDGEAKEEYLDQTAGRRGAGDGNLDTRVLPVTYKSSSVRQRLWRETVAKMAQVAFSDWPLPGPRAVDWCARFVDRRGGGPVDHHRWWVGHLRLQGADFGVQEHEHGMRAFQFIGEYDQVDLPNLVGLEVTLRRCQLIEYHYEKKGKAATGKEQGAGLSREEAAYFTGSHRLGGWLSQLEGGRMTPTCPPACRRGSASDFSKLVRFLVSAMLYLFMLKVRRRVEARSRADQWCADVARSLNEIGGHLCKDTGVCRSSRFWPRVHDLGMANVRASVERWGRPPADLASQGAFDELRANHSYEGAPVAVAPMDMGLLSLSGAGAPADLAQLLRDGRSEVRGFVKGFLLPKDQADVRLGLEGVPRRPYSDPLLHRPREYERLLAIMSSKGMIEFSVDVVETCGLFSAWEKSGKQRLIIDARRSNRWFKDPPKTHLASGDSFARLFAAADLTLELGQTDIQDAFYQLAMPVELRPCFGLAPVRAGRVGVSVTVEGSQVSPSTLVYPRLCVLAMGWTHALNWCQRVLEDISSRVPGLGVESRIQDRRRPPSLSPVAHSEYVDNFVALSQVPGNARAAARGVAEELRLAGLRAHPVEAGPGGEALGWFFSSERLGRPKLSGEDLEALVGHCARAFLVRRELLCCFNAVYAFIARHRHERVPLWDVVRKELRWASHLVCFCWRDLSASVCPVVVSSDASERGCGVTVLEGDKGDIVEAMKYSDRWRFRDGSGGARVQAAELIEKALAGHRVPGERDEGAEPGAVADGEADWGPEGGDRVPLVPERLLKGKWSVVCSRPWQRPEGMPVLEVPVLARVARPLPIQVALPSALSADGALPRRVATPPRTRGPARSGRAEGPAAAPASPRRAGMPAMAPARRARRSAAKAAAARAPARRRWAVSGAPAAFNRVSFLQLESVRPRARGLCQTSWDLFADWARGRKLPIETEDDLETAVLDYFDCKYFEGVHSSLGSRLVCAVCYLRPELSRQRGARLARVRQALRGWSLRSPSQSRLPTPWEVVCLIADLLVRKGRWGRAAAIVSSFQRRWALVLHPMELGRPSKMHRWDDSRILGLDEHQFFAPVLARLRGPGEGSERRLFSFDYPTWAREYRQTGLELGLEVLGPPTLYGLRRAGASLDYALGRRTMLEIQRCGNWAAANSMRRCQKAGRLAEQLHLLAPGARQAALRCAARIGSILAG
ncbi:unnamed protein product, partial [Prorocentrum cordatum]